MTTAIPVIRPGDADPWQSPTENTDLPYDFVPVLRAMEPEVPITHDGANPNQDELYSGELRCTLTTISPLIVGNQKAVLSALKSEVRRKIEESGCAVSWSSVATNATNFRNEDKDSKKIIYPLMHQGRVLVPGEALKGMFRQAFGALTSAPLERISDENYSFRPNTRVPSRAEDQKSMPYAARIVKIVEGPEHRLVSRVELLKLQGLEFVHDKVPQINNKDVEPGRRFKADEKFDNKALVRGDRGPRWKDSPTPQAAPAGARYLRYHYSLDGDWYYLNTAKINRRPFSHPGVIVPTRCECRVELDIDPAVAWQYIETCRHISGEAEGGHFERIRAKESDRRPRMPVLKENDLIFCECLIDDQKQPVSVIMFGHNFMYRWRHLDSITRRATRFNGGQWEYERRREISAHPNEKPGKDGKPEALSAVRNLLGFVKQDFKDALDSPYGGLDKLADPFDRMAGRVSFNFAFERVGDGKSNADRFINEDRNYRVFLHPTVEPKPSSEASYVPGQNQGWGDAIAAETLEGKSVYRLQHGTSAFAGRKFYLHQLEQYGNMLTLPAVNYDLAKLIADGSSPYRPDEMAKFLWGTQTAIASHVSAPGRQFGFTVRFKDLRPWELAALAVVLNPDLLADTLGETQLGATKKAIAESVHVSGYPRFGHKLGHGRALGLGSIAIRIEQAESWKAQGINLPSLIRDHLVKRLDDAVTAQWIKVHRLQSHRKARPYLLHKNNLGKGEKITKWSQEKRSTLTTHGRTNGFQTAA